MLNRTLAVGGAFLLIYQFTGSVVYNQGRKVQGIVVEQPSGLRSSGPPVVGAHVEYLEDGDEEVQVTTTDDKGRFEFPSGRRGIVTASKRGLTTISVAWPPRRGTSSELEIVLPPRATLRGTIYDLASRQVVLDAIVALTVKHPANLVTTGAEVEEGGNFRVEGLPPGPAILLASAPGYAPHISALTISSKSQDVRVGMVLEGAVRGTVVGVDGESVDGASLYVEYNSGFPAGEMLVSFVGGHIVTEEGEFSVNGIVPGEAFGLYAELDGRRSETLSLTALPGTPLEGVLLRIR